MKRIKELSELKNVLEKDLKFITKGYKNVISIDKNNKQMILDLIEKIEKIKMEIDYINVFGDKFL